MRNVGMVRLAYWACMLLLTGCVYMKPAKTNVTAGRAPAEKLSFIHAQGTMFVDAAGKPVILRGCNLGNWLLLEMWMLDIKGIEDQHEFESILAERFGAEGRDQLLDIYRGSFITPRDFEIIRSFGFNTVRVPFDYGILEDDAKPMQLRPDAFRWLDRAVEMAAAAGFYVILDMHGAPGRQSVDHTTGWAGQNRLWTDESCQARMAWLWKGIAAHYRDVAAVAGYDLVNEPFGDYHTANHEPHLAALVDRLHAAIRAVDTRHVLFAPGTLQGIEFYGRPSDRGWTNVAFTEHYYPGLFGSAPTMDSHERFIGRRIPARAAYLERMQAPLLVGEFNVVFKELNAPSLMRRYYDEYAARGWAATMWSYKLLRRKGGSDGWAMVVNRDPLAGVDFRKSTFDEIAAYFASLGTMEYNVNEELRNQLTNSAPAAVAMTPLEWLPVPPATDSMPGWSFADINGSLPGGQRVLADQGVEVYGGGADIWTDSDQFRFIYQERAGDVTLSARIDALYDTDRHAKAGVMFRKSLAGNAAHVLLHVTPGGRLVLGWRAEDGQPMRETEVADVQLPVFLRLERRDGKIRAAYSSDARAWKPIPFEQPVGLGPGMETGLAVLAHDGNNSLTRATFQKIQLSP